jgi:hypothetical protein
MITTVTRANTALQCSGEKGERDMTCPKCKAKVGIMPSEIILEFETVNGCRCIMCGYWKFDHPIKARPSYKAVGNKLK